MTRIASIIVAFAMIFSTVSMAYAKDGLSNKEARSLIKSKHQQYRDCYTAAITAPAGETVRVKAKVTLDTSGRLSHSENVNGAYDALALSSCMTEVFDSIPAAPASRTVTVSFPFLITR